MSHAGPNRIEWVGSQLLLSPVPESGAGCAAPPLSHPHALPWFAMGVRLVAVWYTPTFLLRDMESETTL